MSKSIKISEKHGVNPTMPLCFFCGEEKNEIVLLGKLPGDVEAPRHMWIPGDYEPCEKCKEKWAQGVALIEVTDHENFEKQPPLYDGVYLTDKVAVIKEEACDRIFTQDMKEDLMKHKRGFVFREVFRKMFDLKGE